MALVNGIFLHFNPLADDKILDWSKLKAFADDNLNVAKIMISLYDRVENIVGKGENAGNQHFLLFPQCFQKASFPEASKGVIVWEWDKDMKKFLKNPILRNCWSDFDIISQEYFWVTLFKKCARNFDPPINMALVNGGFSHYRDMKKFLKNLLLGNCWSDFEMISQEYSLSDPF